MSSAHELQSPFALGQPSPVAFCVQRELESWMDTVRRLPERVRDALLTGAAPLAVRTLIAGGAQDENWLTDLVFHARHPDLHGRAIRPGERTLAAEWTKIRTDLIHPLLQAAHTIAAAPPVAPPRRTAAEWLQRALQSAGIDPAKWKPDNGFPSNQPILVLAYDYYAGLFGRNENLLWAGMAKLAGGQVYGGLLEAQGFIDVAARQRMSFAGPDLALELMAGQAHRLQTILLQMQKAIFDDLAWQHQAFQEGGLAALEAAGTDVPMDAWRHIASGDPGRVRAGNRMLLLREQQVIVAPGYQEIRDIKDFDQIPEQMSEKAQSPIPDGKAFRVVVPDGDITLFPDRWKWIETDMLPKYQQLPPQRRRQLVTMTLVDLARRNWPSGADNEVFQGEAPTRADTIAALKRELAEAKADPAKWQDVAIRLKGVSHADLPASCALIPDRDLQAARSAVERYLAGSPGEPAILAAIDARARRRKVSLRPLGSRIWAAYSQVGYNIWHGEQMRNRVWEHIGGSVGKKYAGGDTCSARVSWSFNHGGYPITGAGETNNTATTYNGKKGDGKNYIVWVPSMQNYLKSRWGPPEKRLRTTLEAVAFERTLGPDEVAVFAGPHHSGLIMPGYNDAYVKSDPGVLPVSVWKLPL